MCAGIRDAANLAWKLASVIRDGAAPDLLDTYQSERQPHVREFIALAIRLGGVINTKAIEAGLAVGEARENAPVKLEVKKPLLGPSLALGDLPLAGHLAPQFELKDGRRSDNRIGYSHVLLVESATTLSSNPALSQAGIKILTSDDAEDIGPWLREHGITAALVRPDRYVRGTARNDAELDRLIAAISPPTQVPSAA
jgi:3-(3-hydroxy-phenyl)propionate hydroxylase